MGHRHDMKYSTMLRVIPPAHPASSPNHMVNCPPQAEKESDIKTVHQGPLSLSE